jgi:hypothetical protein
MSLLMRAVLIPLFIVLASCDTGSPTPNPNLNLGWVTGCVGAEFSRHGGTSPGLKQPVFKVTDQLVLAVPKEYQPRAASIDREPPKCTKTIDLPSAHFLQFVLQGNWSAGYRAQDIPTSQDGTKLFQPDRVFVRIEPEHVSTLSPQDQRKSAQLSWIARHDATEKKFEIAGLRCTVPKWNIPPVSYLCRAPGAAADPDADPEVLSLRYFPESAPPFVLIQANYRSPKYGKTHLYWQVWTSDIAHALEIDGAIWNLISEWNILTPKETDQHEAEQGHKP